jgi:hypothetical protein
LERITHLEIVRCTLLGSSRHRENAPGTGVANDAAIYRKKACVATPTRLGNSGPEPLRGKRPWTALGRSQHLPVV